MDGISTSRVRKRKRNQSTEVAEPIQRPLLQPSAKRRKSAGQSARHRERRPERQSRREPRHRTPAAFWNNLSRQWLTPRALREFDRRTVRPAVPLPPDPSELEKHHITELKRFARHGGPSLGDLRAYPEPETTTQSIRTMSSSQSGLRSRAESLSTSNKSSKTGTKKTSAYSRGFEQHLIDHGIYPGGYRYPDDRDTQAPENWEEINQRLAQPRPSLSPSRFSNGAFYAFKRKNDDALLEADVMSDVFPIIAGNTHIPSKKNLPFGNLAPLTDGTITTPQPDFYDGARPQQLDKRVREELGRYVVPSTNSSAPLLPNFFAEAKGPDGSAAVAKRQACYDGATGARGMLHARSYASGGAMEYDGNAYTITSTYHDGQLKVYTVHPTQPADPDGRPDYHMTQINTWGMTGNVEAFRQGASAFRNARDWAKEQRDNAIARANEEVNESQDVVPGSESPDLNLLPSLASEAPSQASATSVDEGPYTSDTVVHESETSTDELALDPRLPAKRSSKHSARSHQYYRKRRNPSGPGSTRRGRTPATISSSRSTAAGNATTQSGGQCL